MRPERGFRIIECILWLLIGLGLVFLFGCHPHGVEQKPTVEKQKAAVLKGGIQCQPGPDRKVYCSIYLEEQIDE